MTLAQLTAGLFDYAGMFPPAALSFKDALQESAAFPTTLRRPDLVDNDMVLAPAALGLLDDDAIAAAGFDRPMRICLVGVALADAEDQAHAVTAFNEERRHGQRPQRITALEVHADDLDEAPQALRSARRALGDVELYFEPKWADAAMVAGLDEAAGMLGALRADGRPIGLKVRCAGPTGLGPAALARVVAAVNRYRLPFKATQGLHHPVAGDRRHGNLHGFLNLAVALRLQEAARLPIGDVEALLGDRDPSSFTFDALGWRRHRISRAQLAAATRLPFHIGSCSIAEPDADLAVLA